MVPSGKVGPWSINFQQLNKILDSYETMGLYTGYWYSESGLECSVGTGFIIIEYLNNSLHGFYVGLLKLNHTTPYDTKSAMFL